MNAILGAHMSIAGGYHRAVERAQAAGCECLQIFTKNNNQWLNGFSEVVRNIFGTNH